MTPNIDFYVITSDQAQAAWQLAAKLAEKTLAAQQTLYLHVDNLATAQRIDDFFWHYQDISFLPHEIITPDVTPTSPILLGYTGAELPTSSILLNLAQKIPADYQQFERVFEIVYQAPEHKAHCRQHYAFYKDQGHHVKSHQL